MPGLWDTAAMCTACTGLPITPAVTGVACMPGLWDTAAMCAACTVVDC